MLGGVSWVAIERACFTATLPPDPGPVLITRKKPVVGHPGVTYGGNNGGAIATHVAGLAVVFDSTGFTTLPAELGGSWVSRGADFLDDSNDLSLRVSTKVVTENEGIPACTGGSRRSVKIYTDYALDRDPIVSVVVAKGKANNAVIPNTLVFEKQADGTTTVEALVVCGVRRAGSGTVPFAAPLGNEIHNQNTTGVTATADGGANVTSFPGASFAFGGNIEHVSITMLIAGERLT